MSGTTSDAGAGRRRLAAVWFADIVGYTSLSAENEDAALQVVGELQRIARAAVEARGGRVVKFIGDAVLTVFDSADSALHAALEMQELFAASDVVRSHGVALRVGVHLGEVMEAPDGDVYGDGVNVASRVEGAAEPGQVAATEAVQQLIRNRPHFLATPLGGKSLKGIAEPVPLYAVTLGGADAGGAPVRRKRPGGGSRWSGRSVGVGVAAAVVAFVSLSIFVAQTAVPEEGEEVVDSGAVDLAGAETSGGPSEIASDGTASHGTPAAATDAVPVADLAATTEAIPPKPASTSPATGMWRVAESTDLLDDSPSVTLTLPSAQGAAATLVVACASRRMDVRVTWERPLTGSALRVRLDDGRDRDDRSQWTLLPDSLGVSYRGDPRRFLRDLLPARAWVAAASTRAGLEVAQFRLAGLDRAGEALNEGCGWR